jgi:LysR family hydrogen peroxide-inducible transcriptional activator
MVKKLEEELDVVIFDRKTNPIITTDCGKSILEEAKKVLYHSYNLKHISSEIKGKIEGELRIGVIPTVAGNLLHRILPLLLKKYPNLKLSIQEITTNNITHQLKMGELDVGILSTPLNMAELEEEVLYYEKLMVYGQVKQSNTKYLSPKDMVDENIWLLEQGNCLTDQIINVCSLNTKKLNANLNFSPNSFDSLLNIVDNLKGLTLIPELYFSDLPKERKKNVRDFETPYPVREISLVYHRPYAKLRLISALAKEIKLAVAPLLQTTKLKNSEMMIAKI